MLKYHLFLNIDSNYKGFEREKLGPGLVSSLNLNKVILGLIHSNVPCPIEEIIILLTFIPLLSRPEDVSVLNSQRDLNFEVPYKKQ